MSGVSGVALRETGNAHFPFEHAHEQHDDKVDQKVQHGCRGKRFEHLKVILHGARASVSSRSYRQRDGRLLMMLRNSSEGREHDAEGHRQQHEAVSLRQVRPRPFRHGWPRGSDCMRHGPVRLRAPRCTFRGTARPGHRSPRRRHLLIASPRTLGRNRAIRKTQKQLDEQRTLRKIST